MREIKFRAWDGKRKKMYYPLDCDHPATDMINGTPTPKLYYLPMSWLLGDSNDWEWMQYTGLKDSKGREIYEGDLVGIEDLGIGEVVFDKGCFLFVAEGAKVGEQGFWCALTDPIDDGRKAEVIGNIYEGKGGKR